VASLTGGPRLPREELEALVHLRLLPGPGEVALRALLGRHRSARAVLHLGSQSLGHAAIAARRDPRVLERLRRSLAEIDHAGDAVLVVDRPGYPEMLLHEVPQPPFVLFARGRLELLQRPAVAVVGSRRHTEYGADAAERMARELGEAGLVVVSGLARGIDGIAHRAALEHGTIAVLGCGLDVPYPRENERLYRRIAEEGLLLSEFAYGTPPLPHNFPRRNRVIAGLAQATVLIEATSDSGSLITADYALDMGREVFVVPGPIGRDTSAGSNAMIQEGGALVTCARDVLEGMKRDGGPSPHRKGAARRRARLARARAAPTLALPLSGANLSSPAAALLQALGSAPRHVDELATTCSLPASTALAELLGLELDGRARQLPGARFVRA
jgi:DNA processing protein